VRSVPAQVCGNCGEEYLSEEAAVSLYRQADSAAKAGVLVSITQFEKMPASDVGVRH
jgi:hypothetical protein